MRGTTQSHTGSRPIFTLIQFVERQVVGERGARARSFLSKKAGTWGTVAGLGHKRCLTTKGTIVATSTVHPNHQLISSEDVEGTNVYDLRDRTKSTN